MIFTLQYYLLPLRCSTEEQQVCGELLKTAFSFIIEIQRIRRDDGGDMDADGDMGRGRVVNLL